MRQGFVKVAAVTPKIVVADTKENTALICAEIKKAEQEGAKIIVLPEFRRVLFRSKKVAP